MKIKNQGTADTEGLLWLPFDESEDEDVSEETQKSKGADAENGAGEVQDVEQKQPGQIPDGAIQIDEDLIFKK